MSDDDVILRRPGDHDPEHDRGTAGIEPIHPTRAWARFAPEHAAGLDALAAAGGLADAFGREAAPGEDGATPSRVPLRRNEALAALRQHAPEMERRFGVRPVALFGSVARDEARLDSDVDVLVEYLRPPGLREFMGAVEYLEAVFGTRVDLGVFEDLKPRVAPYVARELVRVP